MVEITIEPISTDGRGLSRSCNVRVNHSTITTPTRAIGITAGKKTELEAVAALLNKDFTPFGEVYARLSIENLTRISDDDEYGRAFSSRVSLRISQLRDAGSVPYMLISFTDEAGNPYNRLPPPKVLDLLFDLLWGTEGNQLVVPPLMGAMGSEKEYVSFIEALSKRKEAGIDRKDLPLVAIIPSVYRLIAPHLVKKYWDLGCRMFAIDLENKKLGAFGYIIERLHTELSELSGKAKEPYILHAINAKQRVGKGETMRVNDLLAAGYGFDSFGPSHGSRQRWVPQPSSEPIAQRNHVLDPRTYGFIHLSSALQMERTSRPLLSRSKSILARDLSSIQEMTVDEIRTLCHKHNVETEFREIREFPMYVRQEGLVDHFSGKEKVRKEVEEMLLIAQRSAATASQKELDAWFK